MKLGMAFKYSRLITKLALLLVGKEAKSDWLMKRIPAFPLRHADISLTDNCNSKCITCNLWRERKTDEMTTQEVKDVLKQLKEFGCFEVRFTGGEPLLRDDIGEIISYANSIRFKAISVATNGLLLRQKKKEIVESGITNISISLDGVGQTHDMVRGVRGNFEKSMKAIDELNKIRRRKNPFSITIWTTLSKQNVSEIPDILNLCEERNLSWGFNLLDKSPYFFKNIDVSPLLIQDTDGIDEVIDHIKRRKAQNPNLVLTTEVSIEYAREYLKTGKMDFPCYLGMFKVCIGPKGEVYSGCWVLAPLGTLRTVSLKDIMTSDRYHERVFEMYKKKCPGCTCGYGGNVAIEKSYSIRQTLSYISPTKIFHHK